MSAVVDSLTAENLTRLLIEEEPSKLWNALVTGGSSLQYLVPILGGVAPICSTCEGEGCEEGCGTCDMADAGPDSHKVCRTCRGSGVPTAITLTVECECAETDDSGEMIWPSTGCLTRCDSCNGTTQRPVARASLLQVLPIARQDVPDGSSVYYDDDALTLFDDEAQKAIDLSDLLPLASWETSKWALLVKDLEPAESAV